MPEAHCPEGPHHTACLPPNDAQAASSFEGDLGTLVSSSEPLISLLTIDGTGFRVPCSPHSISPDRPHMSYCFYTVAISICAVHSLPPAYVLSLQGEVVSLRPFDISDIFVGAGSTFGLGLRPSNFRYGGTRLASGYYNPAARG